MNARIRKTEWSYYGVTITRSAVSGYYLASTFRGFNLTADTLSGMRELIREFQPFN